MKRIIYCVLFYSLIISCKSKNKLESEIEKLNTDISVERFDQFFGNASKEDFTEIKQAYPFMFSKDNKDSLWIAMINDTLHKELVSEVAKKYPKIDNVEEEIESFFNHLHYYFPHFNPPRVITTTSMVDYRNRVLVTDTIALIALDNYLGEGHFFYRSIQQFTRKNFEESQIVVDLAEKYAEVYLFQSQRKTLLDEMIYHGKILHFKDVMLPNKTEAQRIGYTKEELQWASTNEQYIWRYFIENELLYSTDTKLPSRFINPAPFSKFYLEEVDKDSPGRIGQYLGWQIVKAFMINTESNLSDMLKMSAEDIFNNSKFKPRK